VTSYRNSRKQWEWSNIDKKETNLSPFLYLNEMSRTEYREWLKLGGICMLLIIDGNNIACRSFFTPQGNLSTKQGEPSGVILGVLNSLKGYLDKFPETTKVVVAWDGGRAKWRKALYPEYKANRTHGEGDAEEKAKYDGLFSQIETLHEFLPSLGVSSIKIDSQEADDIIAAICRVHTENKIVVTSDKDMLQLIDEHTSIYTPYKDRIISPLNFYAETGVTLDAFVGYKALLGDSGDNIFGIPGIGEKTAKGLLDKYGHIDNILNPTPQAKKELMKSARTKKIFDPENLKILGRNNKLMNFNYINFEDFEVEVKRALSEELSTDSKTAREFLMRWQFVSLLSNYTSWILSFKSLGDE
jgi:5'-3' exonuclease